MTVFSVFPLRRLHAACMILLLGALSVLPASAQTAPPSAAPATVAAKISDVSSMDAILAAVYDVISGGAGQKRDWDGFKPQTPFLF